MENIKYLRLKTGLSQSKFAERFHIPIRSLQKWEQEESKPLPYLIELIKKDIDLIEYSNPDQYLFTPSNNFKKVIKEDFLNVNKIHPIQQYRVYKIIQELKKYENVGKIYVFGSSVTNKGNYDSDIDIYVELNMDINVKTYDVDCPVDFWSNYTISNEMLIEVKKKGVLVYDSQFIL